ncbi:hypothetical protein DMC25_23095 [Caulobacter sp. D4A]|uniref:hypothetical protein n=1 Tax=unclassified Caulobacter TaxID=2648921 RepID=UPI000D728870|nr:MULTISPECIES: hypothetical protein [unclassified Caulobacter]PXA77567.1 hypothetical protein DMC25_23095 [Caulobacter sp. D4A]PXA96165.1 hypothetical protein DMC18_02235 [Caulobacter sp. D5]
MPKDKGPLPISRRVVIGAASAAPVMAGANVGAAAVSPVVTRCAEWLALDAEIGRLLSRWSDLETILVEQKRWERMTPEERVALSPTEEMDAIDEELKPLFDRQRDWLDGLAVLRSSELKGAVAKLEVALQVMIHQQGDGYDLFKSAMVDLRITRCPNCGTPTCGG